MFSYKFGQIMGIPQWGKHIFTSIYFSALLLLYTKDTIFSFLFFFHFFCNTLLNIVYFYSILQIRNNGVLLGTIAIRTANIWSTSSMPARLLLTNNAIRLKSSKQKINPMRKERKKNGDQYKSRMYHFFPFFHTFFGIQVASQNTPPPPTSSPLPHDVRLAFLLPA